MVQSRPPTAIVGAGVVAQTLGRLLAESGEPVIALASRSRSHAEEAARFIGSSVRVVTLAELPSVATQVVVAVSDEGIAPVADLLAAAGFTSGVALHTCGAKGPSALAPLRSAGVACGVLHPLQTITTPQQGVRSLSNVTFVVTGDPRATAWAEHLVTLLHGRSLRIDADRLSYYHAGAVMASGGIVAALDAALVLLARAGIERDAALYALGPLARTSLDNILAGGPRAALTGPVVRGDVATIAAHLRAVQDVDPAIARLYRTTTAITLELARQRGLDNFSAREVQVLLEEGADADTRQQIGLKPEPADDRPPHEDGTE